jgi:probable F420-dependent oxidoreductase
MTRAFRFGINMMSAGDRSEWTAKCQRAEAFGYDVLLVPDHLGMPAPFPALTLAAEVTERVQLGTFVLNCGFFNPVLLARDAFAVREFSGGRLELGLGAGYVRAEFEQAGLQFPTARERVDHLERTVDKLIELAEKPLPLLIGGNGDRVLRLAATKADIVAFAGLKSVPGDPPLAFIDNEELDERVAYVRAAADGRDYESNLLIQAVMITSDRRGAAEAAREQDKLTLSAEELLEMPALLVGEPKEIADQLRAHRERFGFSYITVLEPAMADFAPVIELLKE